MGKQECPPAGALVERGRIAQIANDGYRVENLDRRGLTSRAVEAMDNTEYAVDDIVLFVMYRDGTGKILCRA